MLDLNISASLICQEFLDKKLDRKELTNANVSIIIDKRELIVIPCAKFPWEEDFDLTF